MRFFAYDATGLARERTYYSVGGGFVVDETAAGAGRIKGDDTQVSAGLLHIWAVMQQCVESRCSTDGVLPGGLKVNRPAPEMRRRLLSEADSGDPLRVMDWENLFALAVNEENAGGGRVLTAPAGLCLAGVP
jgi:L-serine dehydratase